MENAVAEGRPSISLPHQREIRQRCGFGCVVCGLPLYTYEHMEGWARVKRHVPEEITLLCDTHQHERTNGLLPIESVRQANANPINLQQGVSKPYALHFSGSSAEVELGGNWMTAPADGDAFQMVPIIIDRMPLVMFTRQDNHLLLTLRLFDECNHPVMEIFENQLIYSTTPWDITLIGKTLTIRQGKGDFLLEIQFMPPGKIAINRGRFLLNGAEILLRKHQIISPNAGFLCQGTRMINTHIGFCLGSPHLEGHCIFRCDNVPRYGVDRKAALAADEKFLAANKARATLPGLPQP